MIDKAALRDAMREKRRGLAKAATGAAELAALQLPVDAFDWAKIAGAYWPCGAEFDPRPAARRLASRGVRLALPFATARDKPLRYRAWADGALLEPDAWGVPAPSHLAPELTPDVIFVPLLAFDRGGGRIGHGGGVFDRTLQALRRKGRLWAVGVAYASQEIPAVPTEAHDQRVDAMLTEIGYSVVGKDI